MANTHFYVGINANNHENQHMGCNFHWLILQYTKKFNERENGNEFKYVLGEDEKKIKIFSPYLTFNLYPYFIYI